MPPNSLRKVLIVIMVILITGCQPCNKYNLIRPYQYHFLQKVDLRPYQKTYSIGDTIFLDITCPGKMLFDTLSKSLIKADSISFSFDLGAGRLYDFPNPPPSAGYFESISANGVNYQRDTLYSAMNGFIRFTDYIGCTTDSNYHYSIGVIPRAKGIYDLGLSVHAIYDCPNRKTQFPVSNITFQFNLADCNKDIWSSIQSFTNVPDLDSNIDKKTVFILKVE